MGVKDFDSWSAAFNNAGPKNAQKEAEGYKNLDNPTNVVVIGTAGSKEAFLGFFLPQNEQNE